MSGSFKDDSSFHRNPSTSVVDHSSKWRLVVVIDGKRYPGGDYETEEQAAVEGLKRSKLYKHIQYWFVKATNE